MYLQWRQHVGAGQLNLSTQVPLDTEPRGTSAVALGDVDGDGDVDIVTGNFAEQNRLYLNDGDSIPFDSAGSGTLIGSSTDSTEAIALGDMDGDGDLDVVVGNRFQYNKMYLNDGEGDPFDTDPAGVIVGTVLNQTYAIAVADLDGDGDLDLVEGNYNATNKLYLNDGDDNPFDSVGAGEDIGTDSDQTVSVALGDVNSDSNVDVIFGNTGQTNKLYINDGAGSPFDTIGPGSDIGTDAEFTFDIALGDMDGDGDLDVVAGNSGQSCKLYLNDGDGDPFDSVGAGDNITSETTSTSSVAVGDVDGDGDLDIVISKTAGVTNKLYLNDGDSIPFDMLSAGTDIGTDTDQSMSAVLADMDGDGLLDVVVGNYGLETKIYLNDGAGDPFDTVGAGSIVGTDTDNTHSVAVGDIDGDGDLDIVTGNRSASNKYYLSDGDSAPFDSLGAGVCIGTDFTATLSIDLADVDGNGHLDVITGSTTGRVAVYLNDGDSTPFDSSSAGIIVGSDTDETYRIVLGDMDGDGDLDIVAANFTGDTSKLYLNNSIHAPFGTVGAGDTVGTSSYSTLAIAIGDVDRDGDLDLVAGNYSQENRVFLNDGDDHPFDSAGAVDTIGTDTEATTSIAFGDVDSDGDLDVVAGNYNAANKVYFNDGDSAPFDSVTLGASVGTDTDATNALLLFDANRDGHLDVVTGNYLRTNKIYYSDGDSDPFDSIGAGSTVGLDTDVTYAITIADVTGDGAPDLIAGNYNQLNKAYYNDGDSDPFSSVVGGSAVGTDTDGTQAIATGDIDRDGDLDVIAGNDNDPSKVYLNDGDSDPFNSVITGSDVGSATYNARAIIVQDVDRDGDLDILVGNYNQASRLFMSDGDSDPFDNAGIGRPVGSAAATTYALVLGDLDRDGDLDVVTGNYNEKNLLHYNRTFDTGLGRVASAMVSPAYGEHILRATLSVVETVNSATTRNTGIQYYITNNGGQNWYEVTPGETFDFPVL